MKYVGYLMVVAMMVMVALGALDVTPVFAAWGDDEYASLFDSWCW